MSAAMKDTNLCHCNESYILVAEFMKNATISTAKDQHCFIAVVLVTNTTQCLGIYQITFTQHCRQHNQFLVIIAFSITQEDMNDNWPVKYCQENSQKFTLGY